MSDDTAPTGEDLQRRQAEADLVASGDTAVATKSLLSLALHDPDPVWLQRYLLGLLDEHADLQVRQLAVTCLGHVARLHRTVEKSTVVRLRALLDHPVYGGRAEDALDDITTYRTPPAPPDVDWSALRTAHGFASHVPQALTDLLGDDAAQRDRAYWRLDNYVVLQGELYEAAPFVGRHLIAALRAGVPAEKRLLVYRVLYEVRNGYAPDDDTVTLDGEVCPLRAACRRVVGEDPWLFAHDATAPDPALRKEALDMLVSLDDHERDVRRILEGALERAASDETAGAALTADVRRALSELDES